ncbi:Y-family DNA polymerase [Thalassobaculum sp.]|uniref:Y-family DNA polymerase n=1 Tax=Thalassobaculum sp. TaxID=2022740 RepID=UPI003B5C7534
MTDRRIVSIFLPQFPIQRWRRNRNAGLEAEAEPALVLLRDGRHGPVIHDLTDAAAGHGLAAGMGISDARTLLPTVQVEQAALEADQAELVRLARWALRWCPWTRPDGADGLLLDTTGSGHLWGGEAAMLGAMVAAFQKIGFSIRVAAAPTLGAAWALARHGATSPAICAPDGVSRDLAGLPVAALRLDEETVTLLHRLGLKTIGALQAVSRTALVRRFRERAPVEANPARRLDEAFGRLAEPLMPEMPPPAPRALRQLVEPILDVDNVTQVLANLLTDLTAELERRGQGTRRLRLTGYRVDGGTAAVEAAAAQATRDPEHLARLFRDRLEGLEAGFGFEVMTLDALVVEEMEDLQWDLSGGDSADLDLTRLVDRLTAKLGREAVLRPVEVAGHIPERASQLRPADLEAAEVLPSGSDGKSRPVRLLRPPEAADVLYAVPDGPPARLVWRRQTHRVVRSEGPERIAPEWWRERSTTRLRDYYRVEDAEGRRYWIYREGLPGDGRGGAPRWFVHGLDA